jgi:hypothetical protein
VSFSVRDSDLVIVEGLTGDQKSTTSTTPDQVVAYVRFFDLLREAASTGPDAAAIIQRALNDLRAAS